MSRRGLASRVGVLVFGLAAACAKPVPAPLETAGRAVPITSPSSSVSPPVTAHPEGLSSPVPGDLALAAGIPLGEPASNGDRVGRAPRRLDVEQLRAALLAATGFTWVASRTVFDPDSPRGLSQLPDADMLEALAATLGRPDYVTSTHESLDPAVTFTKLAGDAARSACRASVRADLEAKGEKRILRHVGPKDTLAAQPEAVRQNLAYLYLRFWGRHLAPNDGELAPLLRLFERASAPPGDPAEGWRAVCIAMATAPQFLTY